MRTTPSTFAAIRVPASAPLSPTGDRAARLTQLQRTSLSMGDPMDFSFYLS